MRKTNLTGSYLICIFHVAIFKVRGAPARDWFTDKKLIGGDENRHKDENIDGGLAVQSITVRICTTLSQVLEVPKQKEEFIHDAIEVSGRESSSRELYRSSTSF